MKNLQLPLTREWFEMTKQRIKTEDYREISDYWIKRLTENNLELSINEIKYALCAFRDGYTEEQIGNIYGVYFKKFSKNIMTLGYPKSTDTERILKFEHAGIEIRTGKVEWGAEENKLYFVIKHGKPLKF